MTLFGTDRNGGAVVRNSFEIFTPGGVGSWSVPEGCPSTISFTLGHSYCRMASFSSPVRRSLRGA
jgi:hypothetical protein